MKTKKLNMMKTKHVTLMIVALIAFTVSAIATEIPKMNVVTLDESKAYIAAVTSPQFAAEVSVVANDGSVVYYKRTKAADNFKSILDLSHLEDGTYTVKLQTGKVSTQRTLEIDKGKVAVKRMQAQLDPVFSYNGDMLKLSYLNVGQKHVKMSVYDGSQLVFESRLGNNFNIQRAFDVSKMVKGEFDFVLSGNNQFYSYIITR